MTAVNLTLAKIAHVVTSGTSFDMSSFTIQAGDLFVCINPADSNFGIPTVVIPSGFASIAALEDDSADTRIRVSWMVADGTETGSRSLMDGSIEEGAVIWQYRPASPTVGGRITGITAFDTDNFEVSNGPPANQTVVVGSEVAPLILFHTGYVPGGSCTFDSQSPAFDEEVAATAIRGGYKLYNPGSTPANQTAGSNDTGNDNMLQSFGITVQGVYYDLVATGISTGAPTMGTPALQVIHSLTADALAAGAPTLGSPAISQAHALLANALATAAPTLDAPALTQVHALLANALALAAPVLPSPTLTQVHALLANVLTLAAHVLPSAGPVAITHNLVANGLVLSAHTLGSPVLTQVQSLVGNALDVGPHVLGPPILTQVHSIVGNGLTLSAHVLPSPGLVQGSIYVYHNGRFQLPLIWVKDALGEYKALVSGNFRRPTGMREFYTT